MKTFAYIATVALVSMVGIGTANAKSAQAAYTSGGGGYSSGGGGGGSFGGGGGRRRFPLKLKKYIDKQTNVC